MHRRFRSEVWEILGVLVLLAAGVRLFALLLDGNAMTVEAAALALAMFLASLVVAWHREAWDDGVRVSVLCVLLDVPRVDTMATTALYLDKRLMPGTHWDDLDRVLLAMSARGEVLISVTRSNGGVQSWHVRLSNQGRRDAETIAADAAYSGLSS